MEKALVTLFHDKPVDIPMIGVTGGKGGVGKTTVAVNLAEALAHKGYRVALADADVDAPNVAILLGLSLKNSIDVTITQPRVNERCSGCGECVRACRFNALFQSIAERPILLGECNGCEACIQVCPEGAIERETKVVGRTYRTEGQHVVLFTGELLPGEAESSVVVKALKEKLFQKSRDAHLIIVDTSPGTHCNVINALKGADRAYAVTEPTPLGAHDLALILDLLNLLEFNGSVVLNLSDLPGVREEIVRIAREHGTEVSAEIPVDEAVARSNAEGIPVVRKNPGAVSSRRIIQMAEAIERGLLG